MASPASLSATRAPDPVSCGSRLAVVAPCLAPLALALLLAASAVWAMPPGLDAEASSPADSPRPRPAAGEPIEGAVAGLILVDLALPSPVSDRSAPPDLRTAQAGPTIDAPRIQSPSAKPPSVAPPTVASPGIDHPDASAPPQKTPGERHRTERPAAPGVQAPEVDRPARTVRPGLFDLRAARALLAEAERGETAPIRFDWPGRHTDRTTLRAHLTECAGWTVLLSTGTALWGPSDPPGTAWTRPPEVSALMRVLDGPIGREEAVRDEIDRVRRRHGLTGGVPVAVVARAFDARLIGGLIRLAGKNVVGRVPVAAIFRLADGKILAGDVEVGGQPIAGAIDLGRIGRCPR